MENLQSEANLLKQAALLKGLCDSVSDATSLPMNPIEYLIWLLFISFLN